MRFTATKGRPVLCLHCTQWFDVAMKAAMLTCPHCSKRVRVDDVFVDGPMRIDHITTCGQVIVGHKGELEARTVTAGAGLFVDGRVTVQTATTPKAHLGSRAVWSGDCRAGALVVEPGATIVAGNFAIDPPRPYGVQVQTPAENRPVPA